MRTSLSFLAFALALTAQIGSRPIQYQPGAYFPPGFPLQGAVRLLTAPVVEMGQRTRVRIEYTVGDMAIEPGMAVEIWKHFTSDAEEFQIQSPDAPAWFGATHTAAAVRAKPVVHTNWVQRNAQPVFPYRKCAGLEVEQGAFRKGDKITFDLGGAQGVRMQFYEENLFNFRVAITKKGAAHGYGGDAILRVTGGPLRKLRVQAPSVVGLGETFAVEVVPMDEWVSLAKNPTGLTLRITGAGIDGGNFRYDPGLLHYIARDVKATREGALRIEVQTADGKLRATSNPVWVEKDPVHRAYYGELHQHTYLADGRGVFEELYLYGRRVGLLDFGAVTPHHMPLSVTGPQVLTGKYPRDNWPELQRVTKEMNGFRDFVSLLGYEYSVGTQLGGHHNVFFNADRAKSTMELDPKNPAGPIGDMLETLKLARVPTLVIPHIGGGPPDWSHPTDQRIERLFEIASVHGVFEESYHKHLAAGQRQGVIAAGDTHTTSMGIAYPGLIYVNANGLAGVWSFGKNRGDIWNGLYERRTFATTGNQRMLVRFSAAGEPMGGEVSMEHGANPKLHARISGTAPLLRVELVKNGRVIHTVRPARAEAGSVARIMWGDNVYQRRAATGLRKGEMRATGGRLRLIRPVNLDQGFEHVEARDGGVSWETAAVSGDRDGVLVDLSEASGDIVFKLDDSDTMGLFETRVPVERLKREGVVAWSAKGKERHPYMERMGTPTAFFVDAEMVLESGAMDTDFTFQHLEPVKTGDWFYVRAEQLDGNKAWSSPVWVN